MKKKILVKDMQCVHCQSKIQNGLSQNGVNADVNLNEKSVLIEEEDYELAKSVIENLGYTIGI